MNLGKLLAAGKSIINGRGDISYRANKRVYLPKFGSLQNPFQPAAGPEAAAPGRENAAPPARTAAPSVAAKTQKLPPWSPGPARATSWAGRLNPISIWREAQPVKAAPLPVQSELSLDSVKVMHNDLSDADVEVVPMKSRTADPAALPELPPSSRPWEYLAERMFHAARD
jgi:hypothetical protein